MVDSASITHPAPARPPTLMGLLVALPFQLFGMLCGALLLCIVIECIGTHFLWPEQGWHHAQSMLDYELTQLSDEFKSSLVLSDPSSSAHQWVARAYQA